MDSIYIKITLASGVVKKKGLILSRVKSAKDQVLELAKTLKNAKDFSSVAILEIWADDQLYTGNCCYYIWTFIDGGELLEPIAQDDLNEVKKEFTEVWKQSPEGWAEQIPEVNFDLTIMAFDELSSSYLGLSTKTLAERITEIFLENSYDLGEDDMDFPYAKYARRLAKALKQ